jgi:hypothetical protein
VSRARSATARPNVDELMKGDLVKVVGRGHLPFTFQYVRVVPSTGQMEVTLYGPRGRDGRRTDKVATKFITTTPDKLAKWGR